ncbi:MAG: beta-Ala-His dipeptidase [Salinispira sp.]
METNILGYEPELLWQEFQAISNIPRCTGAEARVLEYIRGQAESRGLAVRRDEAGNMLVCLPASEGCERIPGIIIQAHVDMVCEQNMNSTHNFDSDSIRLKTDGDWLSAEGTTLGADNGIAVAMMLALMKGDYPHGPLELLFTIDEEGGLIGALKLDPDILRYTRMINLDSEEEGIFYIGCAGGMETVGHLPLTWEKAPAQMLNCRIFVSGLSGGHSGTEIYRQLGNSLVLASRVLRNLPDSVRVYNIFGGDRHNAIPREAFIDILIPASEKNAVSEIINTDLQTFLREFSASEPALNIGFELRNTNYPARVLRRECRKTLSDLLISIPHGVLRMSAIVEGLVSESTNFAAVRIQDGNLQVLTSQRSDIQSLIEDAGNRTAAPFFLAGGSARSAREYPGWQPNPDSGLLKAALAAWKRETGKQAEVRTIHAGLECGVIGAKMDNPDMISFGPDILGAHTPDERCSISSCSRVFTFLLKFLVSVK